MDSSYSSGLFGLERIHAAIRRRLAPAQINSTARHTAADSGNVGVGVGGGGQSPSPQSSSSPSGSGSGSGSGINDHAGHSHPHPLVIGLATVQAGAVLCAVVPTDSRGVVVAANRPVRRDTLRESIDGVKRPRPVVLLAEVVARSHVGLCEHRGRREHKNRCEETRWRSHGRSGVLNRTVPSTPST